MKPERVQHRYSDALGTVMVWLDDAVIVRWDASDGRTGEYRRMDLDQIIPVEADPALVLGGPSPFFDLIR